MKQFECLKYWLVCAWALLIRPKNRFKLLLLSCWPISYLESFLIFIGLYLSFCFINYIQFRSLIASKIERSANFLECSELFRNVHEHSNAFMNIHESAPNAHFWKLSVTGIVNYINHWKSILNKLNDWNEWFICVNYFISHPFFLN